MKRGLILGLVLIVISVGIAGWAYAYTCPAGSHTFSGGTEASGPAMCIQDIGASGPVGGSGSSSTATTTPSTSSDEGTITPSGSAYDISIQGRTMDSKVDSKVSSLYGTSIYEQVKKLYEDSVDVNWDDYNSVAAQVGNAEANGDYDTSESLQKGYNIRALNRLNDVWTQIADLEATRQDEQARLESEEQQRLENQNQQGAGASIPQFQGMINFNSNFQPLDMKLSASQMQMLGVLSNEQIHGFFDEARREAINKNAQLANLGNANFGKSPLAGRIGNEISRSSNPNADRIQKGVLLSPQNIGNFMNQQVGNLLGI